MNTKKLVLTFINGLDKKVSISIEEPRENITEAEIKTAMDTIIAKNVFEIGGVSLVSAYGAQVVETSKTNFEFVI